MNRLYDPTEPKGDGQFGLTPGQREALVAALEAGYYEIPTNATTNEIAETIGISQQALWKRFRWAHGSPANHALTIEELDFEE